MEAKHISLTPDREYLTQQAQKRLQEFIARQKPNPWLIVEIARLPPLLKIWLQAFLNEDCENEQRQKETSVLLKVAKAAEKIFKKYGVNSLQEWKILLFARMQFDGDSLYSRVYDTDLAKIFSYGENKFQVAGRYSECLEIIKETGLAALIATHNMELATRMNRQLRLKDGMLEDINEPLFAKVRKNFY